MVKEALWRGLAKFLAQPEVSGWLVRRAKRTPYTPIVKNGDLYMDRYWLFNPYPTSEEERHNRKWWQMAMPSVRIHVIRLPDQDRDLHSHPWDARTVILDGGYTEERLAGFVMLNGEWHRDWVVTQSLIAGDTAALRPNDYHRITELHGGRPVYTLFITWQYAAKWGFRVNGKHVYWRDYLRERGEL